MERIIKFRGQRVEDGEWIYGYLADVDFINNIHEVASPSEEVKPETVGQFIGMLDSNGKEIFEGDVITVTVNGKYPKVVKYIPEQMAFCIANIDDFGKDYIYPWQHPSSNWWNDFKREIVIVGNIYDSTYKHLIPLINNSRT